MFLIGKSTESSHLHSYWQDDATKYQFPVGLFMLFLKKKNPPMYGTQIIGQIYNIYIFIDFPKTGYHILTVSTTWAQYDGLLGHSQFKKKHH